MRKNLSPFVFCLIASIYYCTPALSQEHGWEWLNPLPQGDKILQIHFANEEVGWLVPQSSNLFKTTDGGVTWERIQTPVMFAKVAFVDESRGWGIGSRHFTDRKYGIYRTTTGGLRWEQVFPDTAERAYDIKFVDEQNGWVLGDANIWHSNDGGNTWIEQAQGQIYQFGSLSYTLSFRDAKRGWAGGWVSYAFKTVDGGETWTRDSTLAGYSRFSFVDTTYGWAGGPTKAGLRIKITRTTDGGLTWQENLGKMTGEPFPFSRDACLALADDGIYKTVDAGTTWTKLSESLFKGVFFRQQNSGWAWEATSPNFYYTQDGGRTWQDQSLSAFGSRTLILHAVDFIDLQTGWVAGRMAGRNGKPFIAKTADGGKTWQKQEAPFPQETLELFFLNKDSGWAIGRGGMIQKTENRGESWQARSSGKTTNLNDLQFIDPIAGWIVGAAGVILKTTDGGNAWQDVSPGMRIDFGNVCFVDSSYGWVAGGGSVLRTIDGGDTWINPVTDATTGFDRISFIDPAQGWARTQNNDLEASGFLMTSDSGKTWRAQFYAPYMNSGAVEFADAKHGWVVGSFGRIFHTSDGGEIWSEQTGVTSAWLRDFDLAGEKEAWIVGDDGLILHTKTGGLPTQVETKSERMTTSQIDRIYPVYPNPVNGIATIRFAMGEAGEVIFALYDVLGRKQKIVDLGWKNRGQHEITLDTASFPSAIYLYRVRIDDRILSGKITIVK